MLQEHIPSEVFEFFVKSQNAADLLLAKSVLLALGHKSTDIIDDEDHNGHFIRIYLPTQVSAQQLRQLFKRLRLKHVSAGCRTLSPEDWLTKWKRQWKPAPLTNRLDVVPVWYRDQYKPKKGRDYILMDTLLSFGTGLHETTRFMAQFVEGHRGQFKSFMDIGTGTGILAMVALKNGAVEILAIDIGELSVQAAKDNFRVNGLKGTIQQADITTFSVNKKFDFVAANLITHDLIRFKAKILRYVKNKGFLAISGISLDNLKQLKAAFRDLPLKQISLKKGKQWCGLLYQKTTA